MKHEWVSCSEYLSRKEGVACLSRLKTLLSLELLGEEEKAVMLDMSDFWDAYIYVKSAG
jgi:hypothetical protein